MFVIEKINDDILTAKFTYYPPYISRIKKIPGAVFIKDLKKWQFPIASFDLFEEEFKGEIVYKTPRWIIKDEPIPDMSKQYKLNNNIDLPELKYTPYNYQSYGMKFMIDRLLDYGFVFNTDSMGLGKTFQTLANIEYLVSNKECKKILISCKKSIKNQWKSEIEKFTYLADKLDIVIIKGTKKQREKQYKNFTNGIMIINHHLVMNDYMDIKRLEPDIVCVDECHIMKKYSGCIQNAHKEVCKKSKYNILLTATPIMSRPYDIFGLIDIVNEDYFGDYKDFKKRYVISEWNRTYESIIGYKNLDELRDLVQNIIIRRTADEIKMDLPEFVHTKIECDIDKTQIQLIETLTAKKKELNDEREELDIDLERCNDDERKEALRKKIEGIEASLKGLIASEQAIANDPNLFHLTKSKMIKNVFDGVVSDKYKYSSKTEATIELVSSILEAEGKVVIFSKFETSVKYLKQLIQEELNIKVLQYSGEIKEEERNKNIELFHTEEYNVLIGTSALAEGINLQCANYLIHYDLADTPAIEDQRNGRIRRLGSIYKFSNIYYMLTKDSYDVKLLEKNQKKRDLSNGLIELNEAQQIALINEMTKEN
jgi:SNF2 family DNA or RNA helicase